MHFCLRMYNEWMKMIQGKIHILTVPENCMLYKLYFYCSNALTDSKIIFSRYSIWGNCQSRYHLVVRLYLSCLFFHIHPSQFQSAMDSLHALFLWKYSIEVRINYWNYWQFTHRIFFSGISTNRSARLSIIKNS